MKLKATFTTKEIAKFKREARDRKRESGMKLSSELDSIARRLGFANWSLLTKATGPGHLELCNSPSKQLPGYALLQIGLRYIRDLDKNSVRKMCWSGSLWVDEMDVLHDTVTIHSFHTFGLHSDGAIRQYAHHIGAVLLTSFEGLAEQFVDEGDEDDDGNQREPAEWETMYSTEAARSALLEDFENGFDPCFDSLMARLEEAATNDRQNQEH